MTTGFRIHPMPARVDPGLVDRFRSIPIANISGSMSQMTAGGPPLIGPRSRSMQATIPTPQLLHRRHDLSVFVPSC
jgi:hypothetical protein